MTHTGRIHPIERERVASQLDEKLAPCWIREAGPAPRGVFEEPASLTPAVLKEVLGQGETACVVLSSRRSALARQLWRGCLELGLRTYVHAASFDPTEEDRQLFAQTPQVLLRTSGAFDCDLVIGERGRAAIVLLHAPGAPTLGWLRLEGEPAAAAFQLFLRAFWSAPSETFSGGGLNPALDAPFDLSPFSSKYFFLGAKGPVRPKADVTVVYEAEDLKTFRAVASKTILTPASSDFGLVQSLRSRADSIRFDEAVPLPPLCVGPKYFSVLIGKGEGGQPLVLDLPSEKVLSKAVLSLAASARARFDADAILRDVNGEVLLEGGAFRRPPDEVVVDAGVVRAADFDDVESAVPATFPSPDPLARKARWRWRVMPPARPKKATPAKLVAAWNAFDTWAAKRAEQLTRELQALDEDRGTLEKQFDGFKSFFLGATRTTESLLRRLEVIQTEKPSTSGGERAHKVRTEVDQIAAELLRLTDDKAKTRRMELEKQQRAEHERKVADARVALTEETGRRTALDGEMGTLRERLSETRKSAQDGPDAKAGLKKLKSDLHQAEQRLGSVTRRIAELEASVAAEFVFEEVRSTLPKKKQGPAFVPAPEASAPPVPSEDLPSVGTLLAEGADRFLEVEHWEQIVEGTREAKRLAARLVGPVEGT